MNLATPSPPFCNHGAIVGSPVQLISQVFKLGNTALGPSGGQSFRDGVVRSDAGVVCQLVFVTSAGRCRLSTARALWVCTTVFQEFRHRGVLKVLERLHHVPKQLVLACPRVELLGGG